VRNEPGRSFKIIYPTGLNGATYTGSDNAPNVSKYTYNAQLYFDTPGFSTRLACHYRAKYRADPYLLQPEYTQFTMPTARLNAAIDPVTTLCLRATFEASSADSHQIGLAARQCRPMSIQQYFLMSN
jgi:hypothetical protein